MEDNREKIQSSLLAPRSLVLSKFFRRGLIPQLRIHILSLIPTLTSLDKLILAARRSIERKRRPQFLLDNASVPKPPGRSPAVQVDDLSPLAEEAVADGFEVELVLDRFA